MNVDLKKLKDEDIQSYALVRASLLQKLIRRGLQEEALWVANLFLEDGHEKGLRRRLMQICAEDIGLGNPYLLSHLKTAPISEQVSLMCLSMKNREADRFNVIVTYWPKFFMEHAESTKEEVRCLFKVLKLARTWSANKRDKVSLKELKDVFTLLKEKNTHHPETIQDCLDLYLDLARANVHASEDLLSLGVLLAFRNPEAVSVTPQTIIPKEVNPVPQFALDKHTPYGKRLNRGWEHWEKEGALIYPEVLYPSLIDESGKERYPMSAFMKVLKGRPT